MSSTFEILAPASSSLTVEQASKGTLTFQVRNTASSFHNLGVRVAVLNAAGDEDPAAAAAGWFSVAGPTDSFVPAGSTVDCVVTVSPPLTAEVGSVTFVLVAFDSDLADEDFTRSQPATLAVTKKPEEEEEKPPIPFWVWIAVGLGALALVVAIVVIAVNAGGDDDDATAATDDDDATTAPADDDDASTGEVVPLRRLPILFKAYEGNDPLTGALGGVVFKMESSIDSTKTVTTNGDGDGAQELCIVQDPSASTDGRCLKVQAEFSIFASKAGYKNSPVTTLVVADLVEAPKTYVKMVPNASSANPTRPVVVPEKYTLDLEDYMSRYGRELEISGGVIDWKGLRAGAAVTATPQVWLVSYGDQKLQVIKIVREYTGLGLKESKELVDGVDRGPVAIPGLTAEQSKRMAEALSEVGAQVKVK